MPWRAPIRIVSAGGIRHAETRNISAGGVLVEMTGGLPLGARVELFFRLPALDRETETSGIVRWALPDAVGLQFVAPLRAVEVWALNRLLRAP